MKILLIPHYNVTLTLILFYHFEIANIYMDI